MISRERGWEKKSTEDAPETDRSSSLLDVANELEDERVGVGFVP